MKTLTKEQIELLKNEDVKAIASKYADYCFYKSVISKNEFDSFASQFTVEQSLKGINNVIIPKEIENVAWDGMKTAREFLENYIPISILTRKQLLNVIDAMEEYFQYKHNHSEVDWVSEKQDLLDKLETINSYLGMFVNGKGNLLPNISVIRKCVDECNQFVNEQQGIIGNN